MSAAAAESRRDGVVALPREIAGIYAAVTVASRVNADARIGSDAAHSAQAKPR